MKKAFTLLEVNLAIFVMAVGVMAMVALYPLGFRESDQSLEDVAAATSCDAILNSFAAALSATNITWQSWRQVGESKTCFPANGWCDYFNSKGNDEFASAKSINQMTSVAKQAFNQALSGRSRGSISWPSLSGDLGYAVVVRFDGPRCAIAVRATKRPGMLLAQPVYYTEVCFQGTFKE